MIDRENTPLELALATRDILLALLDYIEHFENGSERFKEIEELIEKISNDKIILVKE